MENNFKKTNLFSCPVYKIRIDPNSYDKEKIINDILYNKNLSDARTSSDKMRSFDYCNIHHSFSADDNVKENKVVASVANENFRPINYEKLIAVYEKIFADFFKNEMSTIKPVGFYFEIVNYTAMTGGQYFPLHNHLGRSMDDRSDFSTVHYLNFKPNEHSPTCFYNLAQYGALAENLQPTLYGTLNNLDPDNSLYYENWVIPNEEDDMVIFPSILRHKISAQMLTEHVRITLSTNLNLLNKNDE